MHSALLNYYPPGGFVGWHTNWNASVIRLCSLGQTLVMAILNI
jgi:hypothetical protein